MANNLNSQCRQLYEKLKEAQNIIDNFNVIGMLLSVLGKSEYYSEDFVQRCSDKVQEMVGTVLDSMEEGERKDE